MPIDVLKRLWLYFFEKAVRNTYRNASTRSLRSTLKRIRTATHGCGDLDVIERLALLEDDIKAELGRREVQLRAGEGDTAAKLSLRLRESEERASLPVRLWRHFSSPDRR